MGLTEQQSLHAHLPHLVLVPEVEGEAPAGLVHQRLGHQELGHQEVGNHDLGCPVVV